MADRRIPWIKGPLPTDPVWLTGEQAHYVCRILRLQTGQELVVFDGQGQQQVMLLGPIESKGVQLIPLESPKTLAGPGQLILAVAPPKGERADWLVEKCTELAIQRLVWLTCQRSVTHPSPSKQQRWQRLAAQAARQAQHNWLPQLEPPIPLSHWLAGQPRPITHGYYGDLQGLPAHLWLEQLPKAPTPITFVIGPQGGLTAEEQTELHQTGFQPVALASTILRIETAALSVASLVMAYRPPGALS